MGEFILNGRNYGGSIITPNPSDTPTDSLDSIKIDNTTYEVQGGGGGGSSLIIDAQRYSLEEQVIGIWTDGKPLYQRTVVFTGVFYGSMTIGTNPVVNAETYANIFISARSAGTWRSLAFAHGDQGNNASIFISDSNTFQLRTGVDVTSAWAYDKIIITMLYTKTTDTAGSGGYQAYGFSPIIYSDKEREVGVWRDNKPLYQKTIYCGSIPNNNTITVPTPSNIDKLIYYSGFVYNTVNVDRQRPLPYPADATNTIRVDLQNNELRIVTYGSWTGYDGYLTIQYTKTTDVAGSGEYNTLAIPNVHYSTDEQVIGTWIDGKTLYQKTVTTGGGVPTGATLIEREVMESYDTIKYTKA